MWNSVAAILAFAVIVVAVSLGRILFVEYLRNKVIWISPELLTFSIIGTMILILMWGILFMQWWMI